MDYKLQCLEKRNEVDEKAEDLINQYKNLALDVANSIGYSHTAYSYKAQYWDMVCEKIKHLQKKTTFKYQNH